LNGDETLEALGELDELMAWAWDFLRVLLRALRGGSFADPTYVGIAIRPKIREMLKLMIASISTDMPI
jgi:hypothetical protein